MSFIIVVREASRVYFKIPLSGLSELLSIAVSGMVDVTRTMSSDGQRLMVAPMPPFRRSCSNCPALRWTVSASPCDLIIRRQVEAV